MKRSLLAGPAISLAVILAGCDRPAAALKAPAMQERENSVRDWSVVGQTVADSMAERGLLPQRQMKLAQSPPPHPGRFYINLIRPRSGFLQEVGYALRAEILARGGAVSTTPGDSIVVNLDVAAVRWSKDEPGEGGTLSLEGLAAGTGIVLGANGPYSPAGWFGLAAGAGIAADILRSLSPRTNVEAIWKATIVQSDSYLMEATAPVYVRAGDLGYYAGGNTNRMMASYEVQPPRTLVQMRYVQ